MTQVEKMHMNLKMIANVWGHGQTLLSSQ